MTLIPCNCRKALALTAPQPFGDRFVKVITPGHEYELESMEGGEPQRLKSINKKVEGNALVTVHDGTTNEEAILMLLNRIHHLNKSEFCTQNETAINSLRNALRSLDERTRLRQEFGVEGTPASPGPVLIRQSSSHGGFAIGQVHPVASSPIP
jgi:hypothetical protein